jgi:hypothetical protein
MERIEFLKLGAFCVKRMSLKTQKELLFLAENGIPFNDSVLSELHEIDNGKDFVKACGGKLDISGFMDILTYCDQPTIDRIIINDEHKSIFLCSKEIDGYFVRANAAIYYTNDMDATLKWFEKILGWPGVIEARDEAGNGTYGLIEPHKKTYSPDNGSPYLQLMRGEPSKSVAGFIQVWGLNNLRQRAIDNGWIQLTQIKELFWGANLFVMTTCDGSLIQFYEPIAPGP